MADGRSRSLGLLAEATEWRALAPGWGACVDETCPLPRLLPTSSTSHLPAAPGHFTVGVILSSAQSNRHSLKAKCGGRWDVVGAGYRGMRERFSHSADLSPRPSHTHTHTHTRILLEFAQDYTPLLLALGQPGELSLTVCHWAGGFPSLSLSFLIYEMEMIKIVLPHGGPCVCVCVSRVQRFVTPWTAACQAVLSMGFSRQEYWSGVLFHSPRIFPTQGSNQSLLHLLCWQAGSLPLAPPGKL